ncbi:basement membrane-specific heparan sulfate proteoglycan core protein-like, partial [Astyanax mexicanus]|uniref:basement membrane-specific heparan sulfate proteoglycan core protein-like n=1 Tax=Astyanax mexicanus TaxID=7994 RepID=UPI0020CAAF64
SSVLTARFLHGQTDDLPTPTLTVDPDSTVFTGESVTLKCEITGNDGRSYQWYKKNNGGRWSAVYQSGFYTVNSNTLTIREDAVINGDQYRCRGERSNRPSSQYSNSVPLTVKERPTAGVTINPANQVFRGESVTLRCDLQGGGGFEWTYSWYKGNPDSPFSSTQDYIISPVSDSHHGEYTCRGTVIGTSRYSHTSTAVRLTVSETPKPELTSSLNGAALIGNPVTLYCSLDQSAGWRFYWFKHTQTPESETTTDTHSYTIRPVSVSDGGQYWCRAGRGDPVYYTHYSDALWVNVTDSSLPVTLIVSPSRSQHFTTDTLSLICEEKSNSTGWRVRRYSHSESKVSDCSSGWGSVTGSTCNISSLSTSHTGVYWCESESGGSSNPVNITVHNGSVILENPVHPVTEGDHLTLRCLYRDPKSSDLTADFYKDGLLLQNQTTGEMIIPTVSKSDEGLYHCKIPEKGESPQSWISVRGRYIGASVALGPSLGLSLLFLIILGLICYYKIKKGKQQNTSQNPAPTPLQADDSSAQSSDITYAAVLHPKRKRNRKNDAEPRPNEVTYSEISMKTLDCKDDAHPSDVTHAAIDLTPMKKKKKQKDAKAEPSDVTYADINLKPKKKPKKQKHNLQGGQSSVGDDTVYSELK